MIDDLSDGCLIKFNAQKTAFTLGIGKIDYNIASKFKIMRDIVVYDPENKPTAEVKDEIIEFLYQHLEQYGDARQDIGKAVGYALKEFQSFGGFITLLYENDELLGVVVINHTGMRGYIPENILVYIATHGGHRGKGLGKQLMEAVIERAEGDIALHVEANNPAKFLYEKVGFTNPYLEMRLKKS